MHVVRGSVHSGHHNTPCSAGVAAACNDFTSPASVPAGGDFSHATLIWTTLAAGARSWQFKCPYGAQRARCSSSCETRRFLLQETIAQRNYDRRLHRGSSAVAPGPLRPPSPCFTARAPTTVWVCTQSLRCRRFSRACTLCGSLLISRQIFYIMKKGGGHGVYARPTAAAAAAAAARSISGDCAGGGGGIEKWASSASRVDTGRKDGLPASLHAEARM